MNVASILPPWSACLSAFHLDRWMMGELAPTDAESVRSHVTTCAACSTAVAGMRGVREEMRALPLPIVLAAPPRRRWRPRAAAGALGLVLAACLVLGLRAQFPGARSKGQGPALGMYVQHGGEVRRAGPGDLVAAGDAVRFSVTLPSPAYVAVLSIDPVGRASVYFPEGKLAAPVPAGTDVPLPLGTRLDDTLGEERLLALFCSTAIELEPVRLALQASRDAAPVPEGCQGARWRFVKR